MKFYSKKFFLIKFLKINNFFVFLKYKTIIFNKSSTQKNKFYKRKAINFLNKTFHLLILFLLFFNLNNFCQANIINGNRLHCMTCVSVHGDTTQLDQFRVRHSLTYPKCQMESVECLSHHDICVIITMQV